MFDSASPALIAKLSPPGGLAPFRMLFTLVYQDPGSESIDDSIKQLDKPSLRALGTALVDALQRLATRKDSTQLGTLRSWITYNENALDRIQPLLVAALANEPSDILVQPLVDQAIALVNFIPPRPTTPPQPTLNYDLTPVKVSSLSQEGKEQTRDLVERRLFQEIGGFTYRTVPGFWEKYFEGTPWMDHASTIYESIKEEHVNGEWSGLTDSPNQEKVLNWLFHFQDASTLLSDAKYGYYTIQRHSELTGGEAKRQIDIVTKQRSGNLSDTEHNWKDITVIGELKTSNVGVKGPFLQLACFARDVFTQQPTRRFLHAFMICGRVMEVWVFDRSGAYSGGPFDIHKEPERFIRVLTGYLLMDKSELGLDTFVERHGDSYLIDIPWETGGTKRLELFSKPLICQGHLRTQH
ncbi:hypothetical protein GGS21DRAFT_432935 [Xylaria nigripes]|nr:hypothetical protein GGS21DRAFT_432935 [Xylaria nigripes]